MRHSLILAAVAAAMSVGAASASATLLYSFETGDADGPTDGFTNNGGGITVSQSTIGATVGANSMENLTVAGATFTGALTQTDIPAALSDPSTTSISLDLTVAPGGQFAGAFADIGRISGSRSSANSPARHTAIRSTSIPRRIRTWIWRREHTAWTSRSLGRTRLRSPCTNPTPRC
jgi:hypothetical protein